MKYGVLGIILILSGCSMSMDEYESRVAYCKGVGAEALVSVAKYKDGTQSPYRVECIKGGLSFSSTPNK